MQELYWLEEKARFRENTMKSVAYKKGENIGIKKGIKKNQKDIALKMLQEKIPIATIIKITGLTEEEIRKLKM